MSQGKPKPARPPHHLLRVWDLLSDDMRDQLRAVAGYPPDWRPRPEPPPTPRQRLEGLAELSRIMKLPPGFIGRNAFGNERFDIGEGRLAFPEHSKSPFYVCKRFARMSNLRLMELSPK